MLLKGRRAQSDHICRSFLLQNVLQWVMNMWRHRHHLDACRHMKVLTVSKALKASLLVPHPQPHLTLIIHCAAT